MKLIPTSQQHPVQMKTLLPEAFPIHQTTEKTPTRVVFNSLVQSALNLPRCAFPRSGKPSCLAQALPGPSVIGTQGPWEENSPHLAEWLRLVFGNI